MARSSTSHSARPPETWTNTTGETGRNVPVPRSTMSKGWAPALTFSRWATAASMSSSAISVGPSRVTCVGIESASGSPKEARLACSSSPCGAGIAMETPIVGTVATLPNRRQQSDPVTYPGHRGPGHLARPGRALGEDPVQLRGVVEQLGHALLERLDGRDDHLRDLAP